MAISLVYPVSGPITQKFGGNPSFYAKWGFPGHNGVDFGIPNGTPVKAAVAGTVEKISFEDGGYGNYIKLRHKDGSTTYNTYYAHLANATVSAGQNVSAGTVIGRSNNTGASTGPHLHFGLRVPGKNPDYKGYEDPMPYLDGSETTSHPALDLPGVVDIPNLDFEVTGDLLNVRSGPGINYPKVDTLEKGNKIKGTRLHSQGVWIEFEEGKWCAMSFAGFQYLKFK